jgi:hypothetical protein
MIFIIRCNWRFVNRRINVIYWASRLLTFCWQYSSIKINFITFTVNLDFHRHLRGDLRLDLRLMPVSCLFIRNLISHFFSTKHFFLLDLARSLLVKIWNDMLLQWRSKRFLGLIERTQCFILGQRHARLGLYVTHPFELFVIVVAGGWRCALIHNLTVEEAFLLRQIRILLVAQIKIRRRWWLYCRRCNSFYLV